MVSRASRRRDSARPLLGHTMVSTAPPRAAACAAGPGRPDVLGWRWRVSAASTLRTMCVRARARWVVWGGEQRIVGQYLQCCSHVKTVPFLRCRQDTPHTRTRAPSPTDTRLRARGGKRPHAHPHARPRTRIKTLPERPPLLCLRPGCPVTILVRNYPVTVP